MTPISTWSEKDAFDLPDWLGVDEVTWTPDDGLHSGRIAGELASLRGGAAISCELVAVDVAYPEPLVPEPMRIEAHRAWRYDQVLLAEVADELVVAAPGTELAADQILEMLRRLSKAVGARPEHFAARLYLGRAHSACRET